MTRPGVWPTWEVGIYGFSEVYVEAPTKASARWWAVSRCHAAGYGSSQIELLRRGVTAHQVSHSMAAIMSGDAPIYRVEHRPRRTPSAALEFFIVDVRREFSGNPYVTLWRPKNSGYAYPLPWAGRYSKAVVDGNAAYYCRRRYGSPRIFERYAVPCEVVERLAVAPAKGRIDGDAGPVLLNNARVRAALSRHRYIPDWIKEAKP